MGASGVRASHAQRRLPGTGRPGVAAGVSKEHIAIDEWAKDVTPSDDLRKWFGHDPERWDEFQDRYRHELEGNGAGPSPLPCIVESRASLARRIAGSRSSTPRHCAAASSQFMPFNSASAAPEPVAPLVRPAPAPLAKAVANLKRAPPGSAPEGGRAQRR